MTHEEIKINHSFRMTPPSRLDLTILKVRLIPRGPLHMRTGAFDLETGCFESLYAKEIIQRVGYCQYQGNQKNVRFDSLLSHECNFFPLVIVTICSSSCAGVSCLPRMGSAFGGPA